MSQNPNWPRQAATSRIILVGGPEREFRYTFITVAGLWPSPRQKTHAHAACAAVCLSPRHFGLDDDDLKEANSVLYALKSRPVEEGPLCTLSTTETVKSEDSGWRSVSIGNFVGVILRNNEIKHINVETIVYLYQL